MMGDIVNFNDFSKGGSKSGEKEVVATTPNADKPVIAKFVTYEGLMFSFGGAFQRSLHEKVLHLLSDDGDTALANLQKVLIQLQFYKLADIRDGKIDVSNFNGFNPLNLIVGMTNEHLLNNLLPKLAEHDSFEDIFNDDDESGEFQIDLLLISLLIFGILISSYDEFELRRMSRDNFFSMTASLDDFFVLKTAVSKIIQVSVTDNI